MQLPQNAARLDQERRSSRGWERPSQGSGEAILLVMSAANTRRIAPPSMQSPTAIYTILSEVDGDRGKEWALKLFDLNDPGRELVFGRESDKLSYIDKLRREEKGAFSHIIQPKEMFQDSKGWGCIIMPHAKESLEQRM